MIQTFVKAEKKIKKNRMKMIKTKNSEKLK